MYDRASTKRNWNPRRNSERSVDDEPEWFTSGPTSRLDTIELKGFEGASNSISISKFTALLISLLISLFTAQYKE